eukprot:653509-Pyramimonas_sp.AAC.1
MSDDKGGKKGHGKGMDSRGKGKDSKDRGLRWTAAETTTRPTRTTAQQIPVGMTMQPALRCHRRRQ